MATVRGTQATRPAALEFGKTVVYERTNIHQIEEAETDEKPGFSGWEYDEVTYTYADWYYKEDIANKLAIAELAALLSSEGDE